jgi:hypothetical protein
LPKKSLSKLNPRSAIIAFNINSVYVKSRRAGKILEMSCRAVTYMFVERKGKSGKHKGRKRRKG